MKDYIITSRGVKNKIIEKINDPRLTPTMDRCRHGRTQAFREKLNSEGKPYRAFMSNDKTDVIEIEPPEKHIYAELIDGEWYWLNGCCECNGEKRGWVNSYIECDKHDVCSKCGISTYDEKVTTRWGNKEGWICNTCMDDINAKEKAKWVSKIDDDYCEWDYEGLDLVKCPWCTYEYDAYESYSNFAGDDRESKEECPKCGNHFTITAHTKTEFTMERDE